jgi:hypothetical protein
VVVGDPVAVVDGQRVQDVLPAVDLAGQVLTIRSSLRGDEVEHLQRGLLVREVAAMPDCPAEPRVEALDRVGIRYDTSDAFVGEGREF